MVRICTRHRLLALGLCCFLTTMVWGQDADKESSAEALGIYAEAAGFQNSKQFDLAAAEWRKFVTNHRDDPRALEAFYNLAVCLIQEQKFQKAVEHLSLVIKDAKDDFERLQDAYLNLGWSQYSLAQKGNPKLYVGASDTFQKLLAKYPKGQFRDQALFFGGECFYQQHKFKEATKYYRELVAKHPKSELHSEGMYALGVTYEDTKDYQQAGQVYDQFLKSYKKHELTNEVRMRKAETVLQAGDFEAAAKMFAAVAQTDGFRAEDHARYRQAFCVAQTGEYAKAAEIFGNIADELPNSAYAADATIAAGRSYYRAEQYPTASDWFQRILASDSPHRPEAAHWQARILLQDKQFEAAGKLVSSILPSATKHPFYVSLLLDHADVLYEDESSRKESIDAYLKIVKEYPTHELAAKALYNAVYGAMELADYQRSLTLADEFVAKHGKHALIAEVRKVVAECKLQLGDLEAAAKEFEQLAAGGDKEGTRFELRRGLSLFLSKQYDQAIEVLQRVLKKTDVPDERAEAAFWLGRSLAGKQQFADAVKALETSQQANPEWKQADEVLLHLALSLRRTNEIEKAKLVIEQLIAKFPKSSVLDQAHYRFAEFAYAQADYVAAIKHYSHVIEQWPQSNLVPFSLYGRGWSKLRSGDAEASSKDFEKLRTQFAKHELAGQTLYANAMALHQSGKHESALSAVQSYLGSSPSKAGQSDALYLRGLCHVGLKDFAKAVQSFEQLLETDAQYASRDKVLYELAWAHKNTAATDKAMQMFERLATDSPDSPLAAEAFYHLAEQRYAKKDYREALTRYESASQLAATKDLREKSAYKLGWAHYQLNDFEKARQAFQRQLEVNDASNLAADARFMQGECFFKAAQHREALKAYKLAKSQPSKNETMRVLTYLHAGQAAGQLKEWKQSLEWLSQLEQQFPNSPYVQQAIYERGWAQQNLKNLDDAFEAFQQVATSSRNALGARARFMAGEVLFLKKDYEQAILEFRRVMYGYGSEKAPPTIKKWQSKSAFEAGRCASVLASSESNPDRRSKLIEDARVFFTYVTEKHAQADEAAAAKKQLQKLQPGAGRVSDRRR